MSSSESSSSRTLFFSSGSKSFSFALIAKEMGAKEAATEERKGKKKAKKWWLIMSTSNSEQCISSPAADPVHSLASLLGKTAYWETKFMKTCQHDHNNLLMAFKCKSGIKRMEIWMWVTLCLEELFLSVAFWKMQFTTESRSRRPSLKIQHMNEKTDDLEAMKKKLVNWSGNCCRITELFSPNKINQCNFLWINLSFKQFHCRLVYVYTHTSLTHIWVSATRASEQKQDRGRNVQGE